MLQVDEEKIVGIGLNKTGTMSLAAALRMMEYRVSHDSESDKPVYYDSLSGKRHPRLDKFDVFLDGLWWTDIRAALRVFPNGKFINTIRDKQSWLTSRMGHVLRNRMTGQSGWKHENSHLAAAWYDKHQADIRSAVNMQLLRPGDNYLEMNICGGGGWGKLPAFVGKPQPDTPFPHVNAGKLTLA